MKTAFRPSGWAALSFTTVLIASFALGQAAQAEGEVNLYSSRHYDTDERLYSEFEEQTGIRINRIEDSGSVLIERIKAEGENSPADVFLTTDAGRLWIAEEEGLFQSVDSDVLAERVPEHLRHPDGLWFGFSQRARVIFYDKERVDPSELTSYEDLADPKWEGMICTRTSGNIYMLSLMAAMIEHLGEDGARDWAKGLWENRARDPEGGDTDQLRGIASGQCAIAVANTYYFARALHSDVENLSEHTDDIGVIFPNQDSTGTHVNISGGGVLKHAPNRENAAKFLEYLASESAQTYFSEGNDEYPVVEGVEMPETIASLGDFEADDLNLTALGRNQAKAQEIYNEVGYQ